MGSLFTKILFIISLFSSFLYADFYIVNGDKKVKMSPLTTGKIDFATFDKIAHIERGNDEIHAYGKEVAFNHRHLNFRLATIDLIQTNYTITEWSQKAKGESESYYINFDDYTRDDGVMLQLFYKNRWYAVILGDPLKIMQELFSRKDLDPKKALKAIKRAMIAFKDDEILKAKAKELEEMVAKLPTKKNEGDGQVKIYFK